jgi:shikimate kinase
MTDLLKGLSIFLIGMMGTGKTTVGKTLAKQLSYRFADTDILVEGVTHQSIQELFVREGEEGFREIESQILAELSAYTRSVIATGGGIVLRQKNWGYLRHGLIIWLDAPVEILIERLANDKARPLLQEVDLGLQLKSLLEQRKSLYAQADLHIQIQKGQTPEQIALQAIATIPSVLKSQLG